MSKYTTGEMAKLCGVSVRTVQYYDTRNILIPSELSEGGRRLYSEEDLQKLKIICFLRELGLSINSIGELMEEEDPGSVISLLLEQQESALREEINEQQNKLGTLVQLKKALKSVEHFSVESIGDIAYRMENRKKLHRVYGVMLGVGFVIDAIEWVTFILGITKGIWWPFVVGMVFFVIPISVLIVFYYDRKVDFICPKCHTIFHPNRKESFFAKHTMTTRKLTCPCCGHKGFCVEVYRRTEE